MTATTTTPTPPTGATRRRWRGILGWVPVLLFGERDVAAAEIKAIKKRGAGMRVLARIMSYALLLGFSANALEAFGSRTIAREQATGGSDINGWLTLYLIVAFVVAGDLLLMLICERVANDQARNIKLRRMKGRIAFAGAICLVESVSVVKVLMVTEPPRDWFDWFALGARAALAPLVAIGLATLPPKIFNFRDAKELLAVKLGYHVATVAEGVDPAQADMGAAMQGLIVTQDLTAAERADADELIGVIRSLNPSAFQAEIAKLRADLQAAIAEANTLAIKHTTAAIAGLIGNGELPDHLKDLMPELAGVRMPSLVDAAPGPNSRRRIAAANTAASRSDAHATFLEQMGITPAKRPGNRKGIWMKGTDICKLTDGSIATRVLDYILAEYGKGAVDGRARIAPVVGVMNELFSRNLASDETRKAWRLFVDPTDNPVAIDDAIPSGYDGAGAGEIGGDADPFGPDSDGDPMRMHGSIPMQYAG